MNRVYLDTARLLTQVAPVVFVDDRLALKGGTAINLFIRDMPRLSVDLDLVFTDHTVGRNDRGTAGTDGFHGSLSWISRPLDAQRRRGAFILLVSHGPP